MNTLDEIRSAMAAIKKSVDEQNVDLYLAQREAVELFIVLRQMKTAENAQEVEKLAEEILNLVKYIGHEIGVQENEIRLTNPDI